MWKSPRPPPEALASFTHAMHAHSFALAMRVIDSFALSPAQTLLDVGGGSGSYAIAAAVRHPQLACALLDFPAVCEIAMRYAEQHGVADRIAMIGADMFADAWPSGFDRVLFSDIFHDWDDERCRLLARRAYDALAPGGEVLVHEMLLGDAKDGPLAAVSYSMVMIFVAQGRQRTGRETADILTSAGFAEVAIAATSGGYALVRATKR
jgi:cyclopropane fatty-acyl-phospholipid synthase-like methyltransferase